MITLFVSMGVLRTLSGNSNQELITVWWQVFICQRLVSPLPVPLRDEMDANRTEPRRFRRAIHLGREVADGERSTDDQSDLPFLFPRSSDERLARGWSQMLAATSHASERLPKNWLKCEPWCFWRLGIQSAASRTAHTWLVRSSYSSILSSWRSSSS